MTRISGAPLRWNSGGTSDSESTQSSQSSGTGRKGQAATAAPCWTASGTRTASGSPPSRTPAPRCWRGAFCVFLAAAGAPRCRVPAGGDAALFLRPVESPVGQARRGAGRAWTETIRIRGEGLLKSVPARAGAQNRADTRSLDGRAQSGAPGSMELGWVGVGWKSDDRSNS